MKPLALLGFAAAFLVTQPIEAAATPIGHIDQVVLEGGTWRVKGWACEPGLGRAIRVNVFVGRTRVGRGSWSTTQLAEPEVHTACGLNPALSLPLRFSVPIAAVPAGQPISVHGVHGARSAALAQSGQLGLPLDALHPETSLASASRILVYTAHPDDETLFAPLLGKHCKGKGKICKIVVATRGGGPAAICLIGAAACGTRSQQGGWSDVEAVRSAEMHLSAAQMPAVLEQLGLSSFPSPNDPEAALQRWSDELAARGTGFDAQVHNEIGSFRPDVILSFDPRHGTSCHEEHRALGQAVKDAVARYAGSRFDKANLLLLTTVRRTTSAGTGLFPVVPTDRSSVVYSASDPLSFTGKTGWDYLLQNMAHHRSQFSASDIASAASAPDTGRTVALQRAVAPGYSFTDVRYLICR